MGKYQRTFDWAIFNNKLFVYQVWWCMVSYFWVNGCAVGTSTKKHGYGHLPFQKIGNLLSRSIHSKAFDDQRLKRLKPKKPCACELNQPAASICSHLITEISMSWLSWLSDHPLHQLIPSPYYLTPLIIKLKPPDNINYLRCLLFGGVSIGGKGLCCIPSIQICIPSFPVSFHRRWSC